MPSRRASISMDPGEVDAFLLQPSVMNVATVGVGGRLHLVAMWYGFLDGQPAFWTFAKSQKVQNLRRDPRLTALIEDGDAYAELRGVELVGKGRIVENAASVRAIGRSVGRRYAGRVPGTGGDPDGALDSMAAKRVGVVIEVERVVSWDHRKLAGRY